MNRVGRILARSFRGLVWTVLGVVILLLLIIGAILLPPVQQEITNRAAAFVTEKTGTHVSIDKLFIGFPTEVVIKGLYVEDQQQDTLVYLGQLKVDIDMVDLLYQKVTVDQVQISNLTAHIHRSAPDSTFNFDFIPEAFMSEDKEKTVAETEKDTTNGGFNFMVRRVVLRDLNANYLDEIEGIDARLKLGHLLLAVKKLDLNHLDFHVEQLLLEDTDGRVVLRNTPGPSTPSEESEPTPFNLVLDDGQLHRINLSYEHLALQHQADLQLGSLVLEPASFNLLDQLIEIESISLENTSAQYAFRQLEDDTQSEPEVVDSTEDTTSTGWTITAGAVRIANQALGFHNLDAPETPGQFNPQHIAVSNLTLELENGEYHPDRTAGQLKELMLQEHSGLQLDGLSADLLLETQAIALQNLLMKMPNSQLALQLDASFASLDAIADRPEDVVVKLKLSDTRVALYDLLPLLSDLPKEIEPLTHPDAYIALQTDVTGKLNALKIAEFKTDLNGETRLDISGDIAGLPDIDHTQFDLQIHGFKSSRNAVNKLIDKETLPELIQLPDRFNLKGFFKGSMHTFDTDLALKTTFGDIDISAQFETPADSIPLYQARVHSINTDLGKWLPETDTLGILDFTINLQGRGFDLETAAADLHTQIRSVEVRNYAYRDIEIDAKIADKLMRVQTGLKDSLVDFSLDARANLALERPQFNVDLRLAGIDLLGMGLADEDLRASGHLVADFRADTLNQIDGFFALNEVLLIKNGTRYPVDSVRIDADITTRRTDFSISSGFMNGQYRSNISIAEMESVVMRHVDKYYHVDDSLLYDERDPEHYLEFDFEIRATPALVDVIVPDLDHFAPGRLKGDFNQSTDLLEVDFRLPLIQYAGIKVDSLDFRVSTLPGKIDYALYIKEVGNPTFSVTNTSLYGGLADQELDVTLDIRDSADYKNLYISGKFTSLDSAFRYAFVPEGLVIDNDVWDVPRNHFIEFGPKGTRADSLIIQKGNRYISVQSRESLQNAPLDIEFKRFDLAELAQALESEGDLVSGILNGTVEMTYPDSIPRFMADLRIDKLGAMGTPLGDLTLTAQNDALNIEAEMTLSGSGNQLNVTGAYRTSPEPLLDFNLDLQRLNLSSVEPFTNKQLENMSGYLSGSVKVSGTPNDPKFGGSFTFNDGKFKVALLGTSYELQKETIAFSNAGIEMKKFTVRDENGQTASVNGQIEMDGFSKMKFMLDADIQQFKILDKKKTRDAIFYGNVMLKSQIKIRGNNDKPVISASAQIVKGSNLSLVIPESEAQIVESGGIDEFIDVYVAAGQSEIMTRATVADTTVADLRGIDLRTSLRIDKETSLRIFMDEGGANYVQVRGDADLVFGIDPSGKVTLTGRYEIENGEYQLVYRGIVKRKFNLEQGSSIVWVGDPLQANIDLKARHTVETDALGLIQDQLPATSQADLNRYRQELPFWVRLKMGGELLTPAINFEILLPPEQQGAFGGQIQARLNQLNQAEAESERNKQVFALLILGRFLPSDPFEGGAGAESAARNTMSQILNKQLEKLSERYVKGIDLDLSLDSYEDYSTGQAEGRTELNVGVSKDFMNERLSVRVGGSVDLEGRQQRTQRAEDLIGDLSIEYKLTEDGIWRMRGFRKNKFDGVIDGEIVETGVSIIFTRSYNEFKNLFKRPEAETPMKPETEENAEESETNETKSDETEDPAPDE